MSGRLRRLATQAREQPSQEASPPRREEERQQCALCGEPLPAAHRHLLELPARELRCACRACQVLFDHAAAGGGHYRLLPEDRRRLTGFALDHPAWARLRAPVRTVFLVRDSASEEVVQFYPSPAGAVRAAVDQQAWAALCLDHPVLARLRPDVEALLVDQDHGVWTVPVDDCYALVGTIRTHWRGLTGGREVRERVTEFFTALGERAVTVPAADDSRSSA
ncbi:DUF5947 family protein [Nonomuraea zeae]|uniref:DUF5947 family protein n=1 Tax=Nonomuraea zeae TaxID=1642303 RepID=UPI00197CC717|nr:DUF5947 family protein [Nonomuraea zeae]